MTSMNQEPQAAGLGRALTGRATRRDVLKRAFALGLSAPVVAGLLAACGGDDKATATKSAAAPTTGSAAGSPTTAAATPTTASASPSAGASPTKAASPTTAATAAASPSSAGGTGRVEGGDPLMGKTIEPAASEGGTMIEASSLDLRSLNPVLWNDNPSFSFGSFIFEALIDANPDTQEPVGNLISAWETSADGLTMTLYLRDGVVWHDGQPFVAADVKTTFDIFMNPDAGGSQTSDFIAKIDSVEVVDDATVQCNLKIVNPDFLIGVGNSTICIADHIWNGVAGASVPTDGGATGEDVSRVVGTGPFKFKEWVTNDHATAVRNDDYWGGKPHLDEYIVKTVPDEGAAIQQLRAGEIDYYTGVPNAQVSELEGTDINIVTYDQLNFTFYGYQLDETKSTKFQDPNVRKALLYALDRKSFVENIYFGYAEVAVGTMPPLSWAYHPELIKEKYEFDVDKANQLLDDAGWAMGADGIRAKDGEKLQFTSYTASGFDVFVKLQQAYQESWKAIGVDMTPVDEPFQQLVDRITSTFDFEMFLIGFNWNVPPDQSAMWACNSYKAGFNIVKYCNPKVDDLLNQALVEQDKQKRIQLYTDFQNVLLEDLPMVATEFGIGIDAVNTRVHNMFPNYANTRFNLETWWVDA
jgi:peptide/nickel transport system substrate-binding protein